MTHLQKLNLIKERFEAEFLDFGGKYRGISVKDGVTISNWWLDQIDQLLRGERGKMREEREKAAKITHIHANFNRNGLVEETANKINEIIDAVNLLTPNQDE